MIFIYCFWVLFFGADGVLHEVSSIRVGTSSAECEAKRAAYALEDKIGISLTGAECYICDRETVPI
jgi:hypothetical protein